MGVRTFYWTVFPHSIKYSFELMFSSLALIRLLRNQTRYFSNCGMNSSALPTPSHLGSRIHSSSSRRSPRTLNYPGSTLFCSSTSRSRISPSCPSRPVCGNGIPKLFVTDGLQGMPEATAKSFPESKRQLCLVHVQRNISQATRMRDRKEIMDDFKAVYTKGSRKECDEAFEAFASKWSKPYPKLISSLLGKADSMFCFYEFPKAMWKSIYTSNAAESLNATAKRKTRARIQYNSEDSALIVLAKAYEDYNRNARRLGSCSK